MCGGTTSAISGHSTPHGLSPRVRGNLQQQLPAARRHRSIPACAGEPIVRRQQGRREGVYPRVCGGTQAAELIEQGDEGLSPRVRGEPVRGNRGAI